MLGNKRNPIFILKMSETLRRCYLSIPSELKKKFDILMRLSSSSTDIINDSINLYHKEHGYVIYATNNGKFYIRPARDDPYESISDRKERISNMLIDIKAGMSIEDCLSSVKEPCYYGIYVDTCGEAIELAVEWLLQKQSVVLPKEYNPPVAQQKAIVILV